MSLSSPSSLSGSVGGGMKDLGPLVGAIDQGTGSTRFLVFAANTAELVTYHQIDVESLTPKQVRRRRRYVAHSRSKITFSYNRVG